MNVLTVMLNAGASLAAASSGTLTLGSSGGASFWMPERASTVSADVDWVFNLITWVSIFFFVLILVLTVYFAVKYRRTEGRGAEPSPSHHTPLELTWTIIPLIIVIIIFYMGMKGYIDLRTAPANAYEINVTAKRWDWTFQHSNGCTQYDELFVPLGRPVVLKMMSDDVLHSLYIPAFRVKQDVVPGRITTLWFEATRPGIYNLFCAEYCGTEHSQMVAVVHVLPEEEFQARLQHCAQWINLVPEESLHLAGARLFSQCVSCHSLDGSRGIGPSFRETHELWGKEREFADGSRRIVDENYILDSLNNPGGEIVKGYANQMSSFRTMDDKRKRALAEFIKRLDEFELDANGRLIVPPLPTPQTPEGGQ